ncbi:diacylglycerol kinase family protein [Catenisphaera adipataccumulans]|jgi:undecaprenol kinase|uniref:Diacylglycerol kinase n=1 Tax=Catenisphaera adipataccumulans TaxID=700500 RepID=A0A7W8FWF2_9FIRM|nr:diacylglycerol kinase family protein [Catenisphaera adipataccumulans]MBB5183191.1 diacylglycerol kinase [Catenisphaera adipataccumulans]
MKWFIGRFKYAASGFRYMLRDRSIRLQMLFGLIVLIAAVLLHLNAGEWLWICTAILLVVAAEVFNSCIEGCVDYISTKRDPRAKRIKDMAAAGVSLICILAAIIGLVIFIPKL